MAPLVALVFLWAFVSECMRQTGGALVYSLDDPYIHLALARSIQHGSYGINPGEWASPSSSIAWPFLLAMVPASVAEWAPLIINSACLALTVGCLAGVVRRVGLPTWLQIAAPLAIAFGLNLFGLVMTGMEHSLQVLLVVFVATRLVAQRTGALFYLALGLMPLVRYECLAITLPVAVYLWFTQDKLRSTVTVSASLVLVVLFSWFLHTVGLPVLPASVLTKSIEPQFMLNYQSYPVVVGMLGVLAYTGWGQRGRWFMCLLAPTVGFLIEGHVGWMGRYEVFILAWLSVFLLDAASHVAGGDRSETTQAVHAVGLAALALALSFPSLWLNTRNTPGACQNIAQQQVVMASMARELGQPVAVNDLGLVSLRSGQYVLDLFGLGSAEVAQAKLTGQMSEALIQELMQRHKVEVAFIYENWVPQHPKDWILVASMELLGPKISAGAPSVQLYATTARAAQRLHDVAARFANDPNVPATIRLY